MKIHKEGHKVLRNQIIIYLLIGILTLFNHNFLYYITPIFSIIFLSSLYFFRVPNRMYDLNQNTVYSPCDGKIVAIQETEEVEYYKNKRRQISIFMSPLNVHNQRFPIDGEIKYIKYHPGKHLVAWHPKSSSLNERSTIIIENNKISVLARQIAGGVARRIRTYVKVGDRANAGKEYGFIKFGSRVDIFLPIETKIDVLIGQKVKAGQTIIATY